jgi:putative Mg2+ transporter-C (MgtC) family protein
MDVDYEIVIRFLLAALWGGLVGAEREYRNKSAGFRTMIMISIGSCFFTMNSAFVGGAINPDRIAANIVTGIGFLGAGVIFRSENRVNGITTAATIWTVAAVGMGIGAGHYFAAAVGSVLILMVLGMLTVGEKFVEELHRTRTYLTNCTFSPEAKLRLTRIFDEHQLKVRLIKEVKDGDELSLTWNVVGRARDHDQLMRTLYADPGIRRLENY